METKEIKTESETMRSLLKTLDIDKELLMRLTMRKNSIEAYEIEYQRHIQERKSVDVYAHNENKILLIDTNSRIETLTSIIKEKETHFKKYSEKFDKDLVEMRAKYEDVLRKAKGVQSNNKNVNWLLTNVNKELLESSVEQKVFFYLKLKEVVK